METAMTHSNRGRLTVQVGGPWKLYTLTLPQDATPVGIVSRGEVDTGALVRMPTGIYVQVNQSAIRSLDQGKVMAAIDPLVPCERCARHVVPLDAQGDALCSYCGLVL